MQLSDLDLAGLYAYPEVDRAWVRTSFVSTLDGAATAGDDVSGDLGGAADEAVFAMLRTLADVIVVGAGTARAEGYAPVAASEVDATVRARLGLAPLPPIAVVSRRLDVPDALLVRGQLVVTSEDADADRVAELSQTVDFVQHGVGEIDWPAVLQDLAARGLRRVQCEGGPSLHGTLVGLDLVDELCLTLAPDLAAGSAPRIATGSPSPLRPMTLGHHVAVDDVLLTRWTRDR